MPSIISNFANRRLRCFVHYLPNVIFSTDLHEIFKWKANLKINFLKGITFLMF